LIAGLADRWGRSNLVTYGLLVTALVVLFGLPNAPNLWVYAALYGVLGFVEGIILVTTLALVRDFSPQLGRGSATGLWTMGPVLASLTVALVSSYTLIAFLVVYMATIFRYTEQRANALGNWVWAFDAAALVLVGVLSDKLRVRKPLMIIGIAGTIVATALFALRTNHPGTDYYTFVWILSLLAVFIAFVFAPWLAAFTETVERRNPALVATGLAVWG
jgi:MFS family permease